MLAEAKEIVREARPAFSPYEVWLLPYQSHAENSGVHFLVESYRYALHHASYMSASRRQQGSCTGFRSASNELGIASRHVGAGWVEAFVFPFTVFCV